MLTHHICFNNVIGSNQSNGSDCGFYMLININMIIQFYGELEIFKNSDGTYSLFDYKNEKKHYVFKNVTSTKMRLELETLLKRMSEKWIRETTSQVEAKENYELQIANNQSKVSLYHKLKIYCYIKWNRNRHSFIKKLQKMIDLRK